MKKMLLIYKPTFSKVFLKKLCFATKPHAIDLIFLGSLDFPKKIKTLIKQKPFELPRPSLPPAPQADLLLFVSFSPSELNTCLAAFRKQELYFPLKATLTEQNRNWTLAFLLNELNTEKAMLGAFFNLKKLVTKGLELQTALQEKDPETATALGQLLTEIQDFLTSAEPTLARLKSYISLLNRFFL